MSDDLRSDLDSWDGIERLISGFARAIVVFVPTLLLVFARPGQLLAHSISKPINPSLSWVLKPALFHLLSVALSFFLIATLVDLPETSRSEATFGPDMAKSVKEALDGGRVADMLRAIAPVYLLTFLWGGMTMVLRLVVGSTWTLSLSLNSTFYFVGGLFPAMFLTIIAMGLIFGESNPVVLNIFFAVILLFQYYCAFRVIFRMDRLKVFLCSFMSLVAVSFSILMAAVLLEMTHR